MDLLPTLGLPGLRRCRVPETSAVPTSTGEESARAAGVSLGTVDRIWDHTVALYASGMYPALQLCIRKDGVIVLDRAIGHASGVGPDDPEDAPIVEATPATRFCLFSASKPLTAMVVHKLDEDGQLHIEDRVCDYVPEFAAHGKESVTLRHVLSHRSGIPTISRDAIDLDLLSDPAHITRMLCDAEPRHRGGRRLAYHALTGGFVLGEVVRRVTGRSVGDVLRQKITGPLGVGALGFGTQEPEGVARGAYTGAPLPRPLHRLLRAALGLPIEEAVRWSNDPRFMRAEIPSANGVGTAREVSALYACLAADGESDGTQIFEPRTVRRATSEQCFREPDRVIGAPLRWSNGFMLGDTGPSVFGRDAPAAFGHVGLTNTFTWADPERHISVALLTNGVPLVGPHIVKLVQLLGEIAAAFPRRDVVSRTARSRAA
jgi:CubicO group peptidase (beta-lactamase class C family)